MLMSPKKTFFRYGSDSMVNNTISERGVVVSRGGSLNNPTLRVIRSEFKITEGYQCVMLGSVGFGITLSSSVPFCRLLISDFSYHLVNSYRRL